MEYGKDQIPVLGNLIKTNENGIWINFYSKLTNTKRCVHLISSHSNHYKRNIQLV